MELTIKVNTQIMNSIPIDKGLKRYLIKWFSRMCECNGPSFAVSRCKDLRELLMEYIADPNSRQKLSEYLSRSPIRKNGRLHQLFSYADTNPRAVLAFLKMYLGEADTLVSVEESVEEMHTLLESITSPPRIPHQLQLWLSYLHKPYREIISLYNRAKEDAEHPYHYLVQHHTCDQWSKYWSTWKGRLLKASDNAYRATTIKNTIGVTPTPSMYADSKIDPYGFATSEQFQRDAEEFLGFFPDMRGCTETLPLDILDWLLCSAETSRVFNVLEHDDIYGDLDPDYWWVGQIHHIPKKGTVKRRPIAVPNRFLQKGLVPFQRYLYKILRGLPRDHTFDQTKSSVYVKHRLDRGHYTCSVDLSHATDYLPKAVGDYIVDHILPREALPLEELSAEERTILAIYGRKPNEDFIRSRELFDFMSRAPWKNGEYLDSWKVGQPLGTLPSFGMLALEHNILLESLALWCGYIHSPYTVLGDDVLLFSKRMRTAYIRLMSEMGVPLSLHKSYEHNLVEFAGQVIIRNQPNGYLPDPLKVSWYNLFDYSRNSGFLLSYRELPRGIQRSLTRRARNVSLTGDKFYRLAAELYSAYYASPYRSYMDLTMRVLPSFVQVIESETSVDPESELTSGWTPLTFWGEEVLAYVGPSFRRKSASNKWFKEKYKPLSTNAIIAYTIRAVEMSTLH